MYKNNFVYRYRDLFVYTIKIIFNKNSNHLFIIITLFIQSDIELVTKTLVYPTPKNIRSIIHLQQQHEQESAQRRRAASIKSSGHTKAINLLENA